MSDPVKFTEKREPLSHGEIHTIRWEGLSDANKLGAALEVPPFAGRTVQMIGDGEVFVEGSVTGQDWYPVLDMDEELKSIPFDVRYIRPALASGRKVTIIAMFRRIV